MTKTHRSPAAFIVVAMLAQGGCPDDSGPSDAGTGDAGAPADGGGSGPDAGVDAGVDAGPLLVTDYCESIAPSWCAFYVRCGRMAVADEAECLEVFAAGCETRFEGRYVGLAAEGLLRLSSAGVAACAAHLEDVPCGEQIFELSGPCRGIWEGAVAAGGACGLDHESFICEAGTQCVLGLDFCGECRTEVPAGALCGDGVVTCEDGATCSGGTCIARAQVGESCLDAPCVLGADCENDVCVPPTWVGLGDNCDADNRCPYRTNCVGGVCVLAGGLGEACGAGGTCAAGYCDGTSCVDTKDDGVACEANFECASGACVDDVCAALSGRCF